MAEMIKCDCCKEVYETRPVARTCRKCKATEDRWEQYKQGKMADLDHELDSEKLEWMKTNGLAAPRPDKISVSAPSQTDSPLSEACSDGAAVR